MKTITSNSVNEIIIKNSRFITLLIEINDNTNINNIFENVMQEYPKATHYCYAYITKTFKKASDDGEPGGTAGMPMLNVLEKEGMINTLAITIRYFGGIKLGAGGLVRAYSKSVRDAIINSDTIEIEEGYFVKIEVSYDEQKNLDYILKEGVTQEEKGAHILDVNVGLPDIDEVVLMQEVVKELQSVTNLPLQIDTVDTKAMESAMRIYNGKAMINSVNGKQESMDNVFPLIAKYGGVVVGLTLDENGIPETADGRVAIAQKIIDEASKYGIQKKDIVIDVLTLTISSEPDGAKVTLEALKRVREDLGVNTVLGVSNISFGLPNRAIINSNFYTMAMQNGLSAAIINPSSEDMMRSYDSFCALMGYDLNCAEYIDKYKKVEDTKVLPSEKLHLNLKMMIQKGLKEDAVSATRALLTEKEPLDIINQFLIPALDEVGKGFENGTVFLPQLLMSAEAAKKAFFVLKENMTQSAEMVSEKKKIILATVKGDIHDIGKNIVKVLLENYGFEVIDLGKDVPPELIVEKVLEEDVRLVGLSALMTTTVVSMEETIKLLNEKVPDCKVMVGGAVLNQEYADMIHADFYGKDAMQSVYYAQRILN